jgi:hypothetical protein
VREVPCTLHTMLHLEESRNEEQRGTQRKAGGLNYDILDELLGRERTNQTGNFIAAFVSRPLTTHADGQRIRQAEISA